MVGERLKAARDDAGLTQAALAKLVRQRFPITAEKFSQQHISKLEKGIEPSTSYIAEIAAVLGVSATWLAAGELPRYTSFPDPTRRRCMAILERWDVDKCQMVEMILEVLDRYR